jgi:hypothetical protein
VDYTDSENWATWTVELFGCLYNEYKEGRYEGATGEGAKAAMFAGNRGRSSGGWIGPWGGPSLREESVLVKKEDESDPQTYGGVGMGVVSVGLAVELGPSDDSDMTESMASGDGVAHPATKVRLKNMSWGCAGLPLYLYLRVFVEGDGRGSWGQ